MYHAYKRTDLKIYVSTQTLLVSISGIRTCPEVEDEMGRRRTRLDVGNWIRAEAAAVI
jgi:hypothetical protein